MSASAKKLDNRFKCIHENCKSSFNRKWKLEAHLQVHNGERPFLCGYDDCNKSYTTASHLKRHEDTHESSYKCTFENCDKVLKTKATLKKHLDYFHHEKKHKTYKCPHCDREFNKHNWLQAHIYIHTNEKPYVCPVEGCGKRFLHPAKVRRHARIHEGYVCQNSDCNKKFSSWSLYVKHFKIFHPTIHKCDICEKKFTTAYNLHSHEVVHKSDRELFTCPMPNCSKFYPSKRNLTWHIKSYHDKRPFTCSNEQCSKAFKTEAELERHTSYHDPNKPLRKKKKSHSKSQPSLSCKLSGCAPPKWMIEKNKKANDFVEKCNILEETVNDNNIISVKDAEFGNCDPVEKNISSKNCDIQTDNGILVPSCVNNNIPNVCDNLCTSNIECIKLGGISIVIES